MKFAILNTVAHKGEKERDGKGALSCIKIKKKKKNFTYEPPIPVQYRSTKVKNTISGFADDIPCCFMTDNSLESNQMVL